MNANIAKNRYVPNVQMEFQSNKILAKVAAMN
jgi:hypothetical protein